MLPLLRIRALAPCVAALLLFAAGRLAGAESPLESYLRERGETSASPARRSPPPAGRTDAAAPMPPPPPDFTPSEATPPAPSAPPSSPASSERESPLRRYLRSRRTAGDPLPPRGPDPNVTGVPVAETEEGTENAGGRMAGRGGPRPSDPDRMVTEEVRVPRFGVGADRPNALVRRQDIDILATVLRPSPYYQVDDTVEIRGYYYIFTVRSPHGTYRVVSVRNLTKLCHEIEVLETYLQKHPDSELAKGLGDAVLGVGKGLGNLVVHPGVSIKRIGVGAGRFLRTVGRWVSKPFRDPAPKAADGSDRAKPGMGPAGDQRRYLAYELGLDVYSGNPNIQAFLNRVARERLAGRLALSAGFLFVPGGGLFQLSLTPMGFHGPTERRIRDQNPAELKRTLSIQYRRDLGLADASGTKPAPDVVRLLANPNYSPREQAYIHQYLIDLQGVAGRREAVAFLAGIESPEMAGVVTAQLELLSLLHRRHHPLVRFQPVRNTLAALDAEGTLNFVIANDTVRYWSDVAKSLNLAVDASRAAGARRIDFWTTGDVDRRTVAQAAALGARVYQNILAYPLFSAPREDAPERR